MTTTIQMTRQSWVTAFDQIASGDGRAIDQARAAEFLEEMVARFTSQLDADDSSDCPAPAESVSGTPSSA